jgi:hypothetical protein
MPPIPAIRITPNSSNILLNDTVDIDLLMKNDSSANSDIGYKAISDIFVEKGLTKQTNNSQLQSIAEWKDYVENEGKDEEITYKAWVDSNDQKITSHPYANSGIPLPTAPNDSKEWRWYLIDSVYSSYSPVQPEVSIFQNNDENQEGITFKVDKLDGALVGTPLEIYSDIWFKYGTDALDNPDTDPAIQGIRSNGSITPQLIKISKKNNKPESEVATGPNFPIIYTINIDIAEGEQVDSVIVKDIISKDLLLFDPNTSDTNSVLGSIESTNYSTSDSSVYSVSSSVAPSRLNPTIPATNHGLTEQSITWTIGDFVGSSNDIDLQFKYTVYAPYKDIDGNLILSKDIDSHQLINEDVRLDYQYEESPYYVSNDNYLMLKQLCIQKSVNSDDMTIIPLSLLDYKIDIQVSDFFDLDKLKITDILSDGNYLTNNQMLIDNFSFYFNNNLVSNAVLQNDLTFTDDKLNLVTDVTGNTISDTYPHLLDRYQIEYDLDNLVKEINSTYYSITDPSLNTKAKGGLIFRSNTYADPYPENDNQSVFNFDQRNTGGFELQIKYEATVDQLYYGRTENINTLNNLYNKIDIADRINSSITISSDNANWESDLNEYYETDNVPNKIVDNSSCYETIGSISISKEIFAITRDNVVYDSNSVEELFLQSQDLVTYRVKLQLSHQNFRNLILIDSLPLPVMVVDNISDIGTAFDISSPNSSLPSVDKLKYGPDHTFYDSDDTSIFKHPESLILDTAANNFTLEWNNFQMPYYTPDNNDIITHKIGSRTIDLLYTILATDKPTADGLKLTNQAVYVDESTTGSVLDDNDFTSIILSQPNIDIIKGVVAVNSIDSDTNLSGSSDISVSYDETGFTANSVIDFNTDLGHTLTKLNRGDDVKYCLIVKNTGSDKAFDVMLSDDQANSNDVNQITIDVNSIEVYDGDGTEITISLTEKNKFVTTGMNIGNIQGLYTSNNVLVNDDGVSSTESLSMRIVIYKAQVLERTSLIKSNQKITNEVFVENYANSLSGQNFVTSNKPSDTADVTMKNISISRKIVFNSEDHTNTSNRSSDNLTIGEIYRIKSTIEIPIGTIDKTILRDEIDFRENAASNSGQQIIKSISTLDSGTPLFYDNLDALIPDNVVHVSNVYNSTDSNDDSYYYDSNQYRYADFGKLVNTSIIDNVMEPVIIDIEHIGLVSDGTYNSTKYLGQSSVTNSHNTNSKTRMYLLDNSSTIASSSNTTINIKEPVITINKALDPSTSSKTSQGDKIIYSVQITASNLKAYNTVFTDTIQSDLTLTEIRENSLDGSIIDLNSVYNDLSKTITINMGTMDSNSKTYYIFTTLGDYRTGDLIRNTGYVVYNSLDSTTEYEKPADGVIDELSLSKTYRIYNKTDNADFITYSSLDFDLSNQTHAHELVSNNVSAAIGDTLKNNLIVTIPKGTTYITEITLMFDTEPNEFKSIVPSTNLISSSDIDFESGLTYDLNGSNSTDLEIQPYLFGNSIVFPVNKLFTNNSESSTTMQFPYEYILKNYSSNVRGSDIQTTASMKTLNSQLTNYKINSDTSEIDFTVVEPEISISSILVDEALKSGDIVKFKVSLQVDNRSDSNFSTVAFNPKFYVNINSDYIDTSSTILTSTDNDVNINDWVLNKTDDSVIYITYEPSNSDNVLIGGKYDFDIEFQTKVGLLTGNKININSVTDWTSQLNYSIDSENPESYDTVRYYETIEAGSYSTRSNDYVDRDSLSFTVKDSVEKFRFGVSFEDALDFDYDYEDVVLNVIYRYFRNKQGIKRFMADIHIVARGAAYDHTLGLYYDGLRTDVNGLTRNATWNVVQYSGHDSNLNDNKSNILSYLNRDTELSSNLSTLRDDGIPLIISTRGALPNDSAKVGYEFSANTHNRTDIVKDWVSPSSVRLVVDFEAGSEIRDDEIDGVRKHFLPYIDVRSSSNNSINPSYNDYEYRHYLGSTVDVSFKTVESNEIQSTYTGFPKVIITPVDFRNKADYGEIENYHPLVTVYPDFIDYVTTGLYPDISSMKRMDMIDQRIPEVMLSDSWANNVNTVRSDRFMMITKAEHELAGITGILDKKRMNEYQTRNTKIMGTCVSHNGKVKQLIAETTSQVSEQFVINSSTLEESDIETYLLNNISKLVGDFDCNSTGCVSLIFDSTSNNALSGGSLITSTNIFDQNNVLFTDNNLKFIKGKMVNSDNSTYSNKIVLIDTSNNLVTNLIGDHSAHNANSRTIYDIAASNTEILSIGYSNDLVLTGINSGSFNISGIENAIQVSSSGNGFTVLTSDNEVYYLDNTGGEKQLFASKIVTDVKMSNKYVVIVAQESGSNIYSYDIPNDSESILIRSNVMCFNMTSDWMVSILKDGRTVLDLLDTLNGELPDISFTTSNDAINYIDSVNNNIIVDVKPFKDSVMVCYK